MSRKNFSDYIKSDLKNKILEQKLDVKLTLVDLSKHYDVSTRPVRQAIDKLIEEHVIIKHGNGRLLVNEKVDKRKVHKDEVKKPIDFYEKISQDLILQSLQGLKGEDRLVREQEMVEKYGVSQTIIRQVFSKLHGYGIIEHLPRRGWRLKAFSHKDLYDFNEAREAMELKALQLAKNKLDKGRIETYYQENYYDRKHKVFRTNDDFHQYIIQLTDNRYIIEFFERHTPYFAILFNWEVHQPNKLKETCEQHQAILKNILDEKWKLAKEALSYHILSNHDTLFELKLS